MTWTYDANLAKARDWVRWRVGDTDFDDQLQQDEEIDAAIDDKGNKFAAAALVARTIAGKFARSVDKAVGSLKISASQKYEHYIALAEQLEQDLALRAGAYAGGISFDDMDTQLEDEDQNLGSFSVGMDDLPGNFPRTKVDDDTVNAS